MIRFTGNVADSAWYFDYRTAVAILSVSQPQPKRPGSADPNRSVLELEEGVSDIGRYLLNCEGKRYSK